MPIVFVGMRRRVALPVADAGLRGLRSVETVGLAERFACRQRLVGGGVAEPVGHVDMAVFGCDMGRFAAVAGVGGRGAAGLVDQLLRLARLDDPKPARPTVLDVAPLLLDCVANLAPLASRKDIDLGTAISQPAMIDAVAEEMQTLFTNLIENALLYTQEGGRVDISLQREDGRFAAEIRDTGAGLPEGAETHIFDRFSRAAPEAAEGSGLGLAIARRIAERHGFDLDVRNRTDGMRGVRARVIMPGAET